MRRLAPEAVQRLVDELERDGLELKEVEYRDRAFGSWHVVVRGTRGCVRVAFDGRDGFLSYERWNGGPEYDASRAWEPDRWEQLEVLSPDLAPPEEWTERAIRDRLRHYAGPGA